jgi:Putative Actinobacterial Holin-X, holin superfamily III
MEETFAKVEELSGHVKEYINNRIASVKFGAAEKSSIVMANIIAVAIAAMVLSLFILFGSVALAYVLARWTGEIYWGFLIVAGIYLVIGILVWLLREKLLRLPIMNAMVQQLFKDDTEYNEEN